MFIMFRSLRELGRKVRGSCVAQSVVGGKGSVKLLCEGKMK